MFGVLQRKGVRVSIYSVVAPIIVQIFYVRYISYNVDESVFGKFVLYVSFISLLASFLFSVPMAAMTRYINETSNKKKFVSEFLTLLIPLNVVGIVVIYIYTGYIGGEWELFLVLSLFFVLLNRHSLNKTVIFQLVKRKQFMNISIFEKVARFLFPIAFLYYSSMDLGLLYGLLFGYFVLVLYGVKKTGFYRHEIIYSYRKLRLYFLYAYPLLIINLAVWVVAMSDRFFIDEYVGSSGVGIYALLAQIAGFSSVLASVFTVYVQPIVFKEYSLDKKIAIEKYNKYLKVGLVFFVASYVVFLFIPREFFLVLINGDVILNDEYFKLLHYLVLSSILGSCVTILTNMFGLKNSLNVLAVFWVGAALVNLFGNTFIENHGLYAASISKTIAYAILLMLMLLWVWRKNCSDKSLLSG